MASQNESKVITSQGELKVVTPQTEPKVIPSNMSRQILFAFGPRQAYYFRCSDVTIFDNCSWSFRSGLAKLSNPTYIGLGPGDEEYCALYEDQRPLQMFQFKHFTQSTHLSSVEEQTRNLFKKERVHFSATGLAFGPDRMFVIVHPDGVIRSDYLPASLIQALSSRKQPVSRSSATANSKTYYPNQVSLGLDGAWFLRWADGFSAWDFGQGKAYQGLSALLGEGKSGGPSSQPARNGVEYLVLDQWDTQKWFCVLDSGRKIEYSLPKTVSDKILPTVQKYMEEMETVRAGHTAETTTVESDESAVPPPAYETARQKTSGTWVKRLGGFWRREANTVSEKPKTCGNWC